jgi:hypothetical protein
MKILIFKDFLNVGLHNHDYFDITIILISKCGQLNSLSYAANRIKIGQVLFEILTIMDFDIILAQTVPL